MSTDRAITAVDTSLAIPLLVASHTSHAEVVHWWGGRPLVLCGHALNETYSVLTRLPGDLRVLPADAAALIEARFEPPVSVPTDAAAAAPRFLADRGIAGGAVYDALVGWAAAEAGLVLATRDGRARPTYEAVGAQVIVVA